MKRPEQVAESVWLALRPGGRFVAEFGGAGMWKLFSVRSVIR